MKPILYTILICTLVLACTRYPAGVEETLSQAGRNRGELEKVLCHYREHPEDSLKYQAACFLIDNMKWHLSTERAVFPDSSLFEWHTRFDSLYTNMMAIIPDTALYSDRHRERFWHFSYAARQLASVFPPDTPTIVKGTFPDPQYIPSTFLISHIENAFHVWHASPYASYLTFEQFKEMILPYRAVTGYSFYENGQKLNDMFSKHLNKSDEKTYARFISRYDHYKDYIHQMYPYYQQLQHVGTYDMFVGQKYDCISLADNFCHVFRAYGIPTVVDCNISFRERTGRHFHCTLLDSTGKHSKYNQTMNYSASGLSTAASPSFFRNTFGAQADSPFMLKAEGEALPDYFDTPCIREVTDENYRVAPVQLPIDKELSNNLVYLYTFNVSEGLAPATWGTVDHQQKKARFKNVVYNILYFPVYLKGDSIIPFASPFYITSPDTLYTSATFVPLYPEEPGKKGKLLLKRKYPEKTSLQYRASLMIGGRFEAANREDFKDAVLLGTIETTPILNLQELTPEICRPFRYYRYVAPDSFPTSNMGLLEYLTDEYTPEDSLPPATALPVCSPEEINPNRTGKRYCTLQVDTNNYRYLRYYSAYNPNMQYSSYRKIDLMPLKRPMKVKKIRYAPANAENHIVVGHAYQLMYWDNGWKNAGTRLARYNFLQFDNVPLDRIYWLRDLTAGKEEHPFFYKDGKQLFIYHDTIVPQAAEFYHIENHF